MSARAVRLALTVVALAMIPAMIVSLIADTQAAATTFGLIAAGAIVALVLVSAVAPASTVGGGGALSEELGAGVEARIGALVAAGADEAEVRALVADAVRLGRSSR